MFNEMILEIIELDKKSNNLVNQYSQQYQGKSVDYILERLNENNDFVNISSKCNNLREEVNNYLKNNPVYLTGNQDDNGFLINVGKVIKDNSYALYIYTDISEIKSSTSYIKINYQDLRDYLLSNKEIKRVIVNKDTINVILGKSNFIRGNMFGLIINNKLEII